MRIKRLTTASIAIVAVAMMSGCFGSKGMQKSAANVTAARNEATAKKNALSRNFADIPPSERAYIILSGGLKRTGVSGNIVIASDGDSKFNIGGDAVEAGKYYKVENLGTEYDVRGNLVELTGEELEQARVQIAEWLALWKPAEIGGVVWAGTNVGEQGRFVGTPEDYGNQFSFDEAQRACPDGWRTPTTEEFAALIASGHERAEVSGVSGRMFGSGENRIFLPNSGLHGGWQADYAGCYWSSTPHKTIRAYAIGFNSAVQRVFHSAGYYRVYGMSVRCVKE